MSNAQRNCGCFRSIRELNTLETSWQCIAGLVSVLGQLNNGLGRIMYSPLACALSALDRYLIV